MRLRILASLLAICAAVLLLTACGILENETETPETVFPRPVFPMAESNSDTAEAPTEPVTEGVRLNEDELYSLDKMLFGNRYGDNWYLSSIPVLWDNDDPADIDMYRLFYNGFVGECDNLSDGEIAYISVQTGLSYSDIASLSQVRLSEQRMDAVLREYYGIPYIESNLIGLENCIYFSETDCYYILRSEPARVNVGLYSAYEQENGGFIIYYSYDENNPTPRFVMKLEPNDFGSYTIISNKPVG